MQICLCQFWTLQKKLTLGGIELEDNSTAALLLMTGKKNESPEPHSTPPSLYEMQFFYIDESWNFENMSEMLGWSISRINPMTTQAEGLQASSRHLPNVERGQL
jgi:hypothetical protein